jgi:MFS family permease
VEGIRHESESPRSRWFVLSLSGLTATLASAAPTMAMPVLFPEISADLGLSLVQIGTVWGTASFAGLFTSLVGGAIGDRFGPQRTLAVGCLLLGVAGASRGMSNGLGSLMATVFLCGLLTAAIPMNLHKVCATWFSGRRLGRANAVVSGGMALGFMRGSLASATVLSPWLGGWRHVLFLYGAIAVLLSVPWALSRSAPKEAERRSPLVERPSAFRTLAHVARRRDVWVLGLALLGVGGGIQGLLGYLPTYLREIGWTGSSADSALAGFHAISLAGVLPLAALSDRIGSRQSILIAGAALIACGIGLLSLVDGSLIWTAVLLAGAARDGYMSVFVTAITEIEGVGAVRAGTAIGLAMTLSRVGNLIAPPLGNGLAAYGPRTPFLLWAGMATGGLAVMLFLRRGRALDRVPSRSRA